MYLGRCVCTWAGTYVYPGRHVCTWTDMCVPGWTCVHVQVCVCVHEQACVCTWTDMCIHEQGVCAAYTVAVTQRSSQGGTHTAEPMLLASLALSLQSHVWRGGSSRHLHTRSPALLPGLGDCVQDVALTRMGSSLGPQSCSSDSGHVAHDPLGFLAAPLHLHCSTSLLKREVLQETVPAAGHSGRSSSKGSSRSSTGTLQIGTLAL